MRRFECAAFAGALIFVLGTARADVLLSTGPLAGSTTAAALVPETFGPPISGKDVDVVSPFGKRDVLAPPTTGAAEVQKVEPHEGVDFSAKPGTAVHASR